MRPYHHITIVFWAVLVILGIAAWQYELSVWWLIGWGLLYIHILVLGAIFIGWNFYLYSYKRGENSKQIALTFDDGPGSQTAAILDILKEHHVSATFFTIGKHAAEHSETVKRCYNEGHLIGNHSYAHGFHFDWKSAAAMQREIELTNALVEEITGKKPILFRPPYGVTNPNLARAVRKGGMESIGWSIRSFDTKAKDGEVLLARIVQRIHGGDIILLHDTVPLTTEILTSLINTAREMGYTFVRVDELLGIKAYA